MKTIAFLDDPDVFKYPEGNFKRNQLLISAN